MRIDPLFEVSRFLIGIPILVFGIFGLPLIVRNVAESSTAMAYILYGILILMFFSTVSFYFALYQAFKLLGFIDKYKAFSQISVRFFKNIKICANTITFLYVVGIPLFYIVGEVDDAPGVIIIGILILFASMVISVFAAVLQRLLQEAINIKSENDLTV